jgi:N-dimethylarginine dimethylaminohydrolase
VSRLTMSMSDHATATPNEPSESPIVREVHQTMMEPAEEPAFEQELAAVWGEAWGAHDEVGPLQRALVRPPGAELEQIRGDAYDQRADALVDPEGRWYWTGRAAPDLERVASQHAALVSALRDEGVQVTVADSLGGGFVKSMYVRDPLLTVPGGAVIARMGVRMRRGEEPAVTRLIAELGMPILATITGTGTVEGGSFVKLRPGLAAFGVSIRCNRAGALQLQEILARIGWRLLLVPIPGYSIHLDGHLAMVDRRRALVDVERLSYEFLQTLRAEGIELIAAHEGEEWALNALCLRPGRVLMSGDAPRTAQALEREGVEVVTVEYDEIHKNGGGVHCSTIELVREPAE